MDFNIPPEAFCDINCEFLNPKSTDFYCKKTMKYIKFGLKQCNDEVIENDN